MREDDLKKAIGNLQKKNKKKKNEQKMEKDIKVKEIEEEKK